MLESFPNFLLIFFSFERDRVSLVSLILSWFFLISYLLRHGRRKESHVYKIWLFTGLPYLTVLWAISRLTLGPGLFLIRILRLPIGILRTTTTNDTLLLLLAWI